MVIKKNVVLVLPVVYFFTCVLITNCASVEKEFTTNEGYYIPSYPEDLVERIQKEKYDEKINHYVVLIGANTELRHKGNLSTAYQTLIERGYDRKNIYILDPDGRSPFYPATDIASIKSIEILFEHLSNLVGQEDTFLLYVTGHGKRFGGISYVILNPAEKISSQALLRHINKIYPSSGYLFFDQCYFDISFRPINCNWLLIAVANKDTTSYGTSFPRHFWGFIREGYGWPEAFEKTKEIDIGTIKQQNHPAINIGSCFKF